MPFLDILLSPLLGGVFYTSFCVLPYIVYGLMGVFFGELLKRTPNKKTFYLRLMPAACIFFAAFVIYAVLQFHSWDSFYHFIGYGYIYPDLFRALATISVIIILAGIFYFLEGFIEKKTRLQGELQYLSRHISKYYAIHPCVFLFMSGLTGFQGQSTAVCLVLFLLGMLLTELMVRCYNSITK